MGLFMSMADATPAQYCDSDFQGAHLLLSNASAQVTNSLTRIWDIDQNIPAANKRISDGGIATFPVIVTKGQGGNNMIKVKGYVQIKNNGNADATIGNIIVQLQQRLPNGIWKTVSSDVADATQGDAAKSVKSPFGKIYENIASGSLAFMNADTGQYIELDPQQIIAPGQTIKLRYAAQYNNAILGITAGQKVRSQFVITFGSANSNSTNDMDINGNGIIDDDEGRVQYKYVCLGHTVPKLTGSNDDQIFVTGPFFYDSTGTAECLSIDNPVIGEGIWVGAGDPAGTVYLYNATMNVRSGEANGFVITVAYINGSQFGDIRQDAHEGVYVGPKPNAPSNLAASPANPGINLAWVDNSLNEDYSIITRINAITQVKTKINVPVNALSYTDTNVVSGTKYWYRINATNYAGTSTVSNTVEIIAP